MMMASKSDQPSGQLYKEKRIYQSAILRKRFTLHFLANIFN